jgi:multiple sugar transport system permease protein
MGIQTRSDDYRLPRRRLGGGSVSLGFILLYSAFNLSFCVVIMRDIFRDVDKEVEEAARVEGASLWHFWMIALPLSLDGLVVTAIIIFASCWNEALFASAVTSQHAVTIPVLMLAHAHGASGVVFNIAGVATILAIAPPVILSLLAQRYLARGLSFGAVKG